MVAAVLGGGGRGPVQAHRLGRVALAGEPVGVHQVCFDVGPLLWQRRRRVLASPCSNPHPPLTLSDTGTSQFFPHRPTLFSRELRDGPVLADGRAHANCAPLSPCSLSRSPDAEMATALNPAGATEAAVRGGGGALDGGDPSEPGDEDPDEPAATTGAEGGEESGGSDESGSGGEGAAGLRRRDRGGLGGLRRRQRHRRGRLRPRLHPDHRREAFRPRGSAHVRDRLRRRGALLRQQQVRAARLRRWHRGGGRRRDAL